MAQQTNRHVERLHRHLPFGPSHDAIYEEYQVTGDAIEIATRALEKLLELAMLPKANLVVLTGDAGHGKTYLCRNLLQDFLQYPEEQARTIIKTDCDGRLIHSFEEGEALRPVRIYKDLSEMDIGHAVEALEAAVDEPEAIVIVCVNEGRLRAILEIGKTGRLRGLYDAFARSFDSGLSTLDDKAYIINLNYQAIGAIREDGRGLVRDALSEWLDGRRWQVCKDCDSKPRCPISHNRDMLSPQVVGEEIAIRRQQRLRELFAATERLGTVMTIRELLMTLAYLITGGLHCKDVHAKGNQKGWQHRHIFYNSLFEPPPGVKRDSLERIPVLAVVGRFDPGLASDRTLDDLLINAGGRFEAGSLDLCFRLKSTDQPVDGAEGIETILGESSTTSERAREAQDVLLVTRALRRRDYFDAPDQAEIPLFKRLGFESCDDFLWILQDNADPKRRTEIKNRLIAGLHTIQGLRIPVGESALHLVDPAFGRSTREAAIIARKIPGNLISLLSQSRAWGLDKEKRLASLQDSVDWIERCVVIRVNGSGDPVDLPLNLLAFESIFRAAGGCLPRDFYAHEIRRVLNSLGRIAERESGNNGSEINLFLKGRSYTVSIEEGNIIQISGGLA